MISKYWISEEERRAQKQRIAYNFHCNPMDKYFMSNQLGQ